MFGIQRQTAGLLASSLVLTFISSASMCFAAETSATNSKTTLSLEEIKEKRRAVRQELMLPSLQGLRGISYRVVGYQSFEPLEKLMGEKLAHLGVPAFRFVEMKEGQQPVDAIVQINFLKAGGFDIAELTVMQWVSLLRNDKIKTRAVTYKTRDVVPHGKPAGAVDALTEEFVIDFLKANQNGTVSGASGDKSKASKSDASSSASGKKQKKEKADKKKQN